MAYKTIKKEIVGNTSTTFTKLVLGWDPAAYPANVQISLTGLNGGTFDVHILPPEETQFKTVQLSVNESDLVMLAAKNAPLFQQTLIITDNTNGATSTATLTLWERGI